MRKPVLLIDDSQIDAEFTLRAYARCNLKNSVLLALDAEEALVTLNSKAKRPPDERVGLILLDLKLPKMDGFELLKIIKARPDLEAIPVIVVTGSVLSQDRLRAQMLGAADFVSKSIEPAEFSALLCAAIEPYRVTLNS